MTIFFIGGNQKILAAHAQQLPQYETHIFLSVSELIDYAKTALDTEPLQIIFDLNQPVDHYKSGIVFLKLNFPKAKMWSFFDSDSAILKTEVLRMGFERLLPYGVNLAQLLSDDERPA